MADKFIVNTSALIYDEEGRMLYILRSEKEDQQPGIMGFPGGKAEFPVYEKPTNILDFLETNLIREVKEETNIEIKDFTYFHSHTFKNSNGEDVILLAFISPLPADSKIKVDGIDTAGFGWVKPNEVDSMKTLDVVKHIYKVAFDKMNELKYHQHVEVAGLVINDKNEFLLLKDKVSDKYTFPHGPVENLPGRTWEVLEKNLVRNVFTQSAVEVMPGVIPFTDKEFLGKDGFEKIIQFFICRYQRGEALITDPDKYSEVIWKDINTMKEDEFKPLVFTVFKKAYEFINKINN